MSITVTFSRPTTTKPPKRKPSQKNLPDLSSTGLPGTEVVQIVRPVYGDFNPGRTNMNKNNNNIKNNNMTYLTPDRNGSTDSSLEDLTVEERERILLATAAEGVMNDISGTTIYVVAVICVIPLAGLVAFVVRMVVRKRVSVYFVLI